MAIRITITGPVKCGKTTVLKAILKTLVSAGCGDVKLICDTKFEEIIKKPDDLSKLRIELVEKVDYLYNR